MSEFIKDFIERYNIDEATGKYLIKMDRLDTKFIKEMNKYNYKLSYKRKIELRKRILRILKERDEL